MTRAVVFAYHNVGARLFLTLLAGGVDITLLVTHQDDPKENIWFQNVAELARERGIPVITPENPNTPEVMAQIAAAQPDFIFSFYYRHMLKPEVLALAPRGAYNMHGSLLPKYRGRVPVNWAVIHGETETGASLHEMVEKPDAGRLVAQEAVPILPDDTAYEVFQKVTVAAETCLHKTLPALMAGTAPHQAQDLTRGSYFGGRKPEDGRIHWSQPAAAIHNLVRAVAPPYPGAFCDLPQGRLEILRTLPAALKNAPGDALEGPSLLASGGMLHAVCGDGQALTILSARLNGHAFDSSALAEIAPHGIIPLSL